MPPVRKNYPPPPIDRREILRYAGVRGDGGESIALLDRAVSLAEPILVYRTVFCHFPLRRLSDGRLDLGFLQTDSVSLSKNLADAEEVVLFAATVGLALDRLIAKEGARAPSVALMLDAFGSERIEALADAFCRDLAASYLLRPRFSPGYGDLPLDLQKDVIRTLDCPRTIGLSLTESLLMTPSKSVTALVGVTPITKQKVLL